MRKRTAQYLISSTLLLALCVLAFANAKSTSQAEFSQINVVIEKFESGIYLNNNEKKPAKDVLEADAVSFSRIAVQERNNFSSLNSSFFNTAFALFKDHHTVSKKASDLVTSYLACIYPSHNFW